MRNQKFGRREALKVISTASLMVPFSGLELSAAHSIIGKEQQQNYDDKKPARPVTVIVIGAGNRGWGAYSSYGIKFPKELKVVGVAEPIPYRRERIAKAFEIPAENQFITWEDVFKKPKFADALFITTPDELHYGPAMAGLNSGYDLLLEKVIAQTWDQCNDILKLAEKKKSIVAVCHVLRYTNYFRKMKEFVQSGQIGDIVSIQHLEPVEHIHMSHSFVRGNWGNSKKSNPMILSKSCHDTDILRWIINKPCTRVSSFGSLTLFRKGNAPAGSALRCTDGCSVERECPYSAKKIYLEKREWIKHLNLEAVNDQTILRELKNGPYGRCVYHCDNDVVDHQVTNFEFEGDVTASFSMETMSSYAGRRTRIFGTKGDLTGDENTLIINEFASGKKEVWDASTAAKTSSGHGGGDHGLVHDFVRAVSFKNPEMLSSTIQVSMSSHLMGFRAEQSRLKGSVEKVNM